MDNRELKKGDIVQLNPDMDMFGGCFMVVTEPKSFGAMGYVTDTNSKEKGHAYLRTEFKEMEFVGRAEWVLNDEIDD